MPNRSRRGGGARPYAEVCRRLRLARVPYVIVGVFGASLHAQRAGLVVTTADCDILLPADVKVLGRANRVLRGLGFELEAGVEPLPDDDPVVLAGVVRARACLRAFREKAQVDLPLQIAGYEFADLWPKRRRFRLQGVEVNVASLEHILRSKELAGRPKDRLFLATYKDALEQLLRPRPLPRDVRELVRRRTRRARRGKKRK